MSSKSFVLTTLAHTRYAVLLAGKLIREVREVIRITSAHHTQLVFHSNLATTTKQNLGHVFQVVFHFNSFHTSLKQRDNYSTPILLCQPFFFSLINCSTSANTDFLLPIRLNSSFKML